MAVSVHDLTRTFGDFVAVDHVSFDVARGEIFGFLGANGAGKTTTIKMLTGLLAPTCGTGTVDGLDIVRHVGRGLFPFVLANNKLLSGPGQPHLRPVKLQYPDRAGYQVIEADLIDREAPWRHDAKKLADRIIGFYVSQRGRKSVQEGEDHENGLGRDDQAR